MSLRSFIFGALLYVTSALSAGADTRLVMVEEHGCMWCARWNDEISHIYPKTDVGKAAPLRRVDIHATPPADLTFARKLVFTPTFVLMVDGHEVGRLEGYPGEDFFWGVLEKMLSDAKIDITG
ncbi:MAG: hypothetical protein WA782_20370 [Sulfitobacter sp.]